MPTIHRASVLAAPLLAVLLAVVPDLASAGLSIQKWSTASGAKVLFVESHALPILDVAVEFAAGSSRDDAESSGVANLTLRMLQLGTQTMSEDQISEKLADVGARLSSRFDVDRAGYSLRTLSGERERSQALEVLGAVLHSPSFPGSVLEREKARTLSSLREAEAKPATIAQRNFRELVFDGHPYGLPEAGRPETVESITREMLMRFYRRHYTASNAVIAIIGDVTAAQARDIAEALTSRLQPGTASTKPLPEVPSPAGSETRVIPYPATQAHIRIGMPGMARGDPDYFPLWLGNHILGGGGFTSRLTIELRQKRGLTYSAYSYFAPYLRRGPFEIAVQTKKAQASEALAVTRKTLVDFVANGPTEEEVAAAKQNVIAGFVLRIDSNSDILEYLSIIGFYDLSLDYVDRFPERIAAVTRVEILDAFRRRVDPDRMVTVVVGPSGPL